MPPRMPNTGWMKRLDVQVADVELEPGTVSVTGSEDYSTSLKVFRKTISRVASKWFSLPVMLELGISVEGVKESKVHRPHVERRDLRFQGRRWKHALLQLHMGASPRRDIDNRCCYLLDPTNAAKKPANTVTSMACGHAHEMMTSP
jgi:hypothetical protein